MVGNAATGASGRTMVMAHGALVYWGIGASYHASYRGAWWAMIDMYPLLGATRAMEPFGRDNGGGYTRGYTRALWFNRGMGPKFQSFISTVFSLLCIGV